MCQIFQPPVLKLTYQQHTDKPTYVSDVGEGIRILLDKIKGSHECPRIWDIFIGVQGGGLDGCSTPKIGTKDFILALWRD